jgi:predicted alpha-1,2-mannosidase
MTVIPCRTTVRRGRFLVVAALTIIAAMPASASAAGRPNLVRYVNTFAGTKENRESHRSGETFPGATAPFGMLQWSPDTYPNSSSGGYVFGENRLRGFSLTHLSGAGCPQYRDIHFLPTTRQIKSSPAAGRRAGIDPGLLPRLAHGHERARPGLYRARLNAGTKRPIDAALAATTRTGVGAFTFKRGRSGRILIDAGGSAMSNDSAAVHINPRAHTVTGEASSGLFCLHRPRYRVFFAARFDRAFRRFGTWNGGRLRRRSTSSSASEPSALDPHGPSGTAQVGAFLSFPTKRDRTVEVRVGISFISIANARRNLRAEGGRSVRSVSRSTGNTWNRLLNRIQVSGGSRGALRTFYTNLYHALVAPRTFSDADGRYIGMDGRVHKGRGTQYTDFSGWDIYRSQIPLLAMLTPGRVGDMVSSLLNDAQQSGCLPRWPVANGQTMVQIGDPSDPIIASAAAFGALNFDTSYALAAMLKGAEQPCTSSNGSYVERQGLAEYLSFGYVPHDLNHNDGNQTTSLLGDPNAVWGSASTTLEYATADFAIAQFAARVGHNADRYRAFMARSGAWRNLLNPATGYLQPRYANGSFPVGFEPESRSGFVEGNSAQYTWMVPFDLSGLAQSLGGPAAAASRLDGFFTKLNAGAGEPFAALGNEPTQATPWIYDWLGQPYKTQAVVRAAALGLFASSPGGYPGNDDLGSMSSWYVFSALGFYPMIPGVDVLALASPIFKSAVIKLPHGTVTLVAPDASPENAYIGGMRVNGNPHVRPWIDFCTLARGARLNFALQSTPDTAWGAAESDAPPSFSPQAPQPAGECQP